MKTTQMLLAGRVIMLLPNEGIIIVIISIKAMVFTTIQVAVSIMNAELSVLFLFLLAGRSDHMETGFK